MLSDRIVVHGARILVKEDVLSEETNSGIVLPGREKEPTFQGTVLQVGEGAMLEDGTLVPVRVKVGDKVMYTAYSGSPIQLAGSDDPIKYIILNERDVLCVILPE